MMLHEIGDLTTVNGPTMLNCSAKFVAKRLILMDMNKEIETKSTEEYAFEGVDILDAKRRLVRRNAAPCSCEIDVSKGIVIPELLGN